MVELQRCTGRKVLLKFYAGNPERWSGEAAVSDTRCARRAPDDAAGALGQRVVG
jgi:hypothetical protein